MENRYLRQVRPSVPTSTKLADLLSSVLTELAHHLSLVGMEKRYLAPLIEQLSFRHHKMAFVSGPRQCGKTTLAKTFLSQRKEGGYYNWDDVEFRRLWANSPKRVVPENTQAVPLVVLDEIHKARSWKRSLKGVFDTLTSPVDILVTGSARLNVYRKGGDSLLGRYFHFRLHPFSLAEMDQLQPQGPNRFVESLFTELGPSQKRHREHFEALMKFGSFPEPLFAQDEKFARVWRKTRVERVIREDLRDLTRIPELSRIEMLASLLPERVGSPLSRASLSEVLEVSFDTIRRWLFLLNELYYSFELKPYHRSISRSMRRDAKLYLWDYSEIQNEAARFENLVAAHVLKLCDFWNDSGEGNFELCYLRDKEKNEIDFLMTKDGKPWLPIEAKLNNTDPDRSWAKFGRLLPCKYGVQIVAGRANPKIHRAGDFSLLVCSASDFLPRFI